jgi:hypothetical protein
MREHTEPLPTQQVRIRLLLHQGLVQHKQFFILFKGVVKALDAIRLPTFWTLPAFASVVGLAVSATRTSTSVSALSHRAEMALNALMSTVATGVIAQVAMKEGTVSSIPTTAL